MRFYQQENVASIQRKQRFKVNNCLKQLNKVLETKYKVSVPPAATQPWTKSRISDNIITPLVVGSSYKNAFLIFQIGLISQRF